MTSDGDMTSFPSVKSSSLTTSAGMNTSAIVMKSAGIIAVIAHLVIEHLVA